MKIEVETLGKHVVLHLNGRLDVAWSDHVLNLVRQELRDGRHHVWIDASALAYLSSAGIRVLIQLRREVTAVQGEFFVIRPSEFVDQTLRMSGLDALIASASEIEAMSAAEATETGAGSAQASLSVEGMSVEVHPLASTGGMVLRIPARWLPWAPVGDGDVRKIQWPVGTVGLGIGAAGQDLADVRSRFGEFMAVAGCMALQPADSQQHLPDFVTQTGSFIPEINAIQALVGEGSFSTLLRFHPDKESGRILLSDLMAAALQTTAADAVVLVVLAEAEGLVGTALARSPGLIDAESQPGRFPEIRDWVNFCGERVHAGTSALVVSFAARTNATGPWTSFLTRLPSQPEIAAHSHAAAFPFRPLPEGPIPLDEQVKALFDVRDPLDLLHLVEDDRPLVGLGQSAFIRGACWCAPLRLDKEGPA